MCPNTRYWFCFIYYAVKKHYYSVISCITREHAKARATKDEVNWKSCPMSREILNVLFWLDLIDWFSQTLLWLLSFFIFIMIFFVIYGRVCALLYYCINCALEILPTHIIKCLYIIPPCERLRWFLRSIHWTKVLYSLRDVLQIFIQLLHSMDNTLVKLHTRYKIHTHANESSEQLCRI